jgi:hypothetical protein
MPTLITSWRQIPIAIRFLSIFLWVFVGALGVMLVMDSGAVSRRRVGLAPALLKAAELPVGVFLVIAAGFTIAQQWMMEVLCIVP